MEYKGLIIATNYRGNYCIDASGFVYNHAINGYGSCSMGTLPYFIKLLKNNIDDYTLTAEGLKILKQYNSCSFKYSCLGCIKYNKNINCIINRASGGN